MRIIDTSTLTESASLDSNSREWIYNGLDAAVTLEVVNAIKPQLSNRTQATYDLSRALQAPILEMMLRGILVDLDKRREVITLYRRQSAQLEEQFNAIVRDGVGVSCSWSSPHQLKRLFYEVLGLKPVRKRDAKSGAMRPTVDREALESLTVHFYAEPLINHILALRDIAKKLQLLETEIDPDGRLRSNLNIAGTKTGRLASSESALSTGTNVQNIDRDLRSVFIADPGYKLCNIDLEQADARNVGARCWNLFVRDHGEGVAGRYLDACEEGDLHTNVAKMCFRDLPWGTRPDREIADTNFYRNFTYRDQTKRLGHGSNYLGTPRTMAARTKIPYVYVAAFQPTYFGAFPCIPWWHAWIKQQLEEEHMLVTLWGRQRHFFSRVDDPKTHREAVAYDGQSATAEEINHGLLALWRGQRVQLLNQVHDSILFQYREGDEAEVIPWALATARQTLVLEKGREFCVPLEAKVGWNWGDATPENVDGLKKWKGGDDRKRTRWPTRQTLGD